jgi:predicted transcriptional regulator
VNYETGAIHLSLEKLTGLITCQKGIINMQVLVNLPSFLLGLIIGILLVWLYYRYEKVQPRRESFLSEVLRFEGGLYLLYDLMKWFRRPNKKKDEKNIKNKELGYNQKIFNFLLTNRLLRKVSDGDDESYCLTEKGKMLCDLLDEISEELEIPDIE